MTDRATGPEPAPTSGSSAPEVAGPSRPKRPRGVTIVAVMALLQAVLLVLVGLALVLAGPDADVEGTIGLTPGTVRPGGAVLMTVGVVEGVLAVLLARGSDAVRSAFAALQTVHVATAVYGLAALRDVRAESVWALLLPVLVLWLLYGSAATTEFFER
jgi:hypothetical protein